MDYSKLQHQNSINTVVYPGEGPSSITKNHLLKDEFSGPIEKRRRTNVEFLVLFGIFIAVWFALAFYCIAHGDLSRLHIETDQKSEESLKNFVKNAKIASGEIYLSCTLAIGLSILLIWLFRRFAAIIVWLVVGMVIATSVLVTGSFWIKYLQEKQIEETAAPNEKSSSLFVLAIFFTIFTIIISLVVYAVRKSIKMVIRLFIEAAKVAQAMPLILVQPLVTLFNLGVSVGLCIYFALYISTAGFPQKNKNEDVFYGGGVSKDNEVIYVQDEIMMFANIYNLFALIWITQFFIGCQHMVIAGTTATWYFTRDKSRVVNAISKSYTYLCKYHLGSVAVGSLLITIVKIIRFFYSLVKRNNRFAFIALLFRCVFKYLEQIVTVLTRNAYIEIAIYGDGFWVSGKRAFHVLVNNVVKVSTINSVGDFVMLMGRLMVVFFSVGFGYLLLQGKPELDNVFPPLLIIGLFAFGVAHAFMIAFEMIVDSIFICFCEDCEINDGIERPYYMNKELMVFIDKDIKVLRVGDAASY